MKISEIKENPKNPRKISADHLEKLVKSIKDDPEMMELRPIVYDPETMEVLGGNQRLAALKKAGYREIPEGWAVPADKLTAEQKKRFILKDNANLGEWDFEVLSVEFEDFDLADIGLESLEKSISTKEIKDIDPKTEELENLHKNWDVKVGQIWKCGKHRIMCGDSTKKEDVERLLNGEKVSIVLTDPPYGISVVDKTGRIGKSSKFSEIAGDESTEVAKRFHEICKSLELSDFIIWGGNYFTDFLEPSRCWLVWFKNHPTERSFANCELAWTNIDYNSKTYKITWDGFVKEGESGGKLHPTQKPVKLLVEILSDFATSSGVVYDGFLGSGSTMIACENLGKKCYGMEICPAYVAVSLQRYKDLTGETPTLEG